MSQEEPKDKRIDNEEEDDAPGTKGLSKAQKKKLKAKAKNDDKPADAKEPVEEVKQPAAAEDAKKEDDDDDEGDDASGTKGLSKA